VGELGNDFRNGGNGNDILEGADGDDQLRGDDGNDYMIAGRGNDLLVGGNGDDLLRGGQGNDVLYGFNGNDMLFGDLGVDTLSGGAGNDTFFFDAATSAFNPSPVTAPDQIVDFDLNGDDVLHLGVAANATNFVNSGQSASTLAGAAAIADADMDGTVIYVTVNVTSGLGPTTDNTVVFWDTDGDGHPDEAVALDNTPQVL